MEKEELIALLREPNQAGQAVDKLSRLIEVYPYFHTGHQLYLKGLQQTDAEKMAFQLNKAALCVRDRDVLYHYLHPLEQKNESKSNDALIDAFLHSNPKIVPGNNNYQVDLSESLQENLDDGTDTLAEIYAEQGHIDKAIEIYEHLILKYPEKHIYFAAQIERLNERLKN